MNKGYTIQIGNSDDKLSQKQWAEYVSQVGTVIKAYAREIHFFGCSGAEQPWQNAAWFFEVKSLEGRDMLMDLLSEIRESFHQNSIAWTEGKTVFI